jgi:uroporphyrinogen decarboxylase
MYSEKENFSRVLRREEPSHVCYPAPSKGGDYAGAWPAQSRPGPDACRWRDEWGVLWVDRDGEIFPVGPAVESSAQVDRVEPPDPDRPDRLDALRALARDLDRERYFLSVNHPYFLYEKAINILGPDEFACAMLVAPENAHRLLDMIVEFELGIARRYVALRPDHVNLSDDYGHQDRLAMSPECWREFIKPRVRRVIDFYREQLGPDVTFSQHSCGHVMPLLEDMIELGIQVLHPMQTTANDLEEARRITSGRLTIAGAIDGQRVLPFGTSEDVRREVFNKLDLLWEGGGYLPMAEKNLGVPEENRRALDEAVREWSRMNVES